LIIYILHHIYIYIQDSYSVKREKNIIDTQTKKYKDIIDTLTKSQPQPQPFEMDMEDDLEVFLNTTVNSLPRSLVYDNTSETI